MKMQTGRNGFVEPITALAMIFLLSLTALTTANVALKNRVNLSSLAAASAPACEGSDSGRTYGECCAEGKAKEVRECTRAGSGEKYWRIGDCVHAALNCKTSPAVSAPAAAPVVDVFCQNRPANWQGECVSDKRFNCVNGKKNELPQRWQEGGIWKKCQNNLPVVDTLQTSNYCDWSSQCAVNQICDPAIHQCVNSPGNQNNYCAMHQGSTWCESDKRYQCGAGNNRQSLTSPWCEPNNTVRRCEGNSWVNVADKKCVGGQIKDIAPAAPPVGGAGQPLAPVGQIAVCGDGKITPPEVCDTVAGGDNATIEKGNLYWLTCNTGGTMNKLYQCNSDCKDYSYSQHGREGFCFNRCGGHLDCNSNKPGEITGKNQCDANCQPVACAATGFATLDKLLAKANGNPSRMQNCFQLNDGSICGQKVAEVGGLYFCYTPKAAAAVPGATGATVNIAGNVSGSIISNGVITFTTSDGKVYTVKTDQDGNFTLDLPQQTYTVTVSALGYQKLTFRWSPDQGKDYFTKIKLIKIGQPEKSNFEIGEAGSLRLLEGWNLITLNVRPLEPILAADLAKMINEQGGLTGAISRWSDGRWESYLLGIDQNNFEIILGAAYFVQNLHASRLKVVGEAITQPLKLTLRSGWNSVGLPVTANCVDCTAKKLLGLNNQLSAVSNFQSSLWQTIVQDSGQVYGEDFTLEARRGYFLKSAQEVVLEP
ncbi:MAG: carboxypeptidase-like regulatory domain-containing protein [Candidatus Shapirobacteria bacterium]